MTQQPPVDVGTYSFAGLVDDSRLHIQSDISPETGPAIRLHTGINPCTIPVAKVPQLVAILQTWAQHAAHQAGQLPCPHPNCGPCSFDRDLAEG